MVNLDTALEDWRKWKTYLEEQISELPQEIQQKVTNEVDKTFNVENYICAIYGQELELGENLSGMLAYSDRPGYRFVLNGLARHLEKAVLAVENAKKRIALD